MSKTGGLTTKAARREKFGLKNPSVFKKEEEAQTAADVSSTMYANTTKYYTKAYIDEKKMHGDPYTAGQQREKTETEGQNPIEAHKPQTLHEKQQHDDELNTVKHYESQAKYALSMRDKSKDNKDAYSYWNDQYMSYAMSAGLKRTDDLL